MKPTVHNWLETWNATQGRLSRQLAEVRARTQDALTRELEEYRSRHHRVWAQKLLDVAASDGHHRRASSR